MPSTGVQRVAEEIVRAIDRALEECVGLQRKFEVVLLVPSCTIREIPLKQIKVRKVGFLISLAWEQFELPFFARGSILLNLCNVGPLIKKSCVTMVHDAQVHTNPASYSLAFRAWYNVIQPIIGKRHAKLITVSEFSRKELVAYNLCREDRLNVVYNGVDHMQRVGLDNGILERLSINPFSYVLGLANAQPHKNIGVLIKSFIHKDLESTTLVLFGSITREKMTDTFGNLPSNVLLAGRVSDTELRSLMENALCLAFPSRTEGFGLPPVEAMSVGCPVVVAPCGAVSEVCGDGAEFADADCPVDWVDSIVKLRSEPQLRKAKIQAGFKQAKKYSWLTTAYKILEISSSAHV